MSFSRYIPFGGCGGPERIESLWGVVGSYCCLLLPAVARSAADRGATSMVTIQQADFVMVSTLAS